jgi:hypothetical protein
MATDELENISKDAVVVSWKHYPRIFVERLRNPTKKPQSG